MRHRFIALLPTLALTLAIPVVAFAADQTGVEGVANSIDVNAPSADVYLLYHGRLFVLTGTASAEFRWGGTSCGSRTMTPEMVALLTDSVRQGSRITPTYQDGQGGTKCLVGFTVKPPAATSTGGGKK